MTFPEKRSYLSVRHLPLNWERAEQILQLWLGQEIGRKGSASAEA